MFKKLKEKITEEVKSSPQRFQQLTQSVSDKLQGTSTPDENLFSIGEDDANTSNMSSDQGFSSVTLVSPSADNKSRRMSNSSLASDVSFLPRYEAGHLYHLQSDLDISASEIEDNASQTSSQLGHLSKEQIYNAFQKSQIRYHKYRGRYTDLARHYQELERENAKMKSVLVETQDKAIRRITELKEQCALEQKAKAHLESALRDDLDEKQMKIQSLQTKIGLLQQGQNVGDNLIDLDKKDTANNGDSDKLEQLTKYLNDARSEIEALNSRIQEYKAGIIISQSKEQEYKAKIAGLEKDIASFSEREKENNIKLAENKMELHQELLGKDSQISKLKKDIESLKATLNAHEKDGKSIKIENLQSQNSKLIEKVESLTQKCNGLENELLKVEKYKLEIRELTDKNVELNKSLEKEEKLKDRIQELVDENNQFQNVIESLKVGLSNCQDNLKRLTEEKNGLISTVENEKRDYEKQIETLRDSAKKGLFTLEKQILERLEQTYGEKEEALKQEFKAKLEEISSSNNTTKEIQLQLVEKEDIIKTLSEELQDVKDKLIQKDSKYRELETNHLELIEESAQLRSSISNLEKQIAEIGNESNKVYEEKIGRLQANIKTLQEELTQLQKIGEENEKDNAQLAQDVIKLENANAELLHQVRSENEKQIAADLETTDPNLLELKVQALEEEKKSLLENFEMERQIFNNALEEHKELKIKEIAVAELHNRIMKLEEKIVRLKGYLRDKENSIVELNKIKLNLEHDLAKAQETLRIDEEREEAIELDKTECNLLQIKVQQLENEKESLMKSFEKEREVFDQSFHKKNEEFDAHKEEIMNENVALAKDVLELKVVNEELSEKVRLFEEKEQAVELETTECNLLKLKVQELENEKLELVFNFEREREMFNKILVEHQSLKLKEECIKDLERSNQHLTEQIAELMKEKLDLDHIITNLNETLKLKEEEVKTLEIEKTKCNLLQKKVETLKEENLSLQNSFKLEKAALSSRMENKIEEFSQGMKMLDQKKNEIVVALEKEKTDLRDSFEKERKNFDQKIQELIDENSLLKKEKDDQKVKELIEENSLLKKDKETLNNRLKEQSDWSGIEIFRLQNDLDRVIKECDNVKKVLAEREELITELSQAIVKQEHCLDDKKDKIESMSDRMEAALERERSAKRRVVQKLKEMQQELEKKNDEIGELKKSLGAVEKLYREVTTRQSMDVQLLEDTKRKLCSMENEKLRLEREIKKKTDEYNFKAKEMSVIEQQFSVLTQDKDSLTQENKRMKEIIEELRQECENLRSLVPKVKELDQCRKQNQVLQSQCDKLNQEISELKVRINQLSSDNRNINEEHERLITEVEGYKAKNEFLENEKGEFESIKAKFKEENSHLEMSVTNLTEKLEQSYKDLENASRSSISTPNELDLAQIQQDFLEIKGKCDNLYVENTNLKAEYTKLEEQCNNFSKVKKELENQMAELERHYNEVLHEKQLLQDEVHELKISPINASSSSSSSSSGSNTKLDNLSIIKQEKSLLGAIPNGPNPDNERLQKEIESLREKVIQYKSLDITNKSSIEFYENELQKMKTKHEKLNRKLDETLVTLNHCAELSSSTEIEYLKNVLYNYMLGKESLVLARVIAAVCKFDPNQTEAVLQKEQQKQTLLGQWGLL